ncbi:MAG TPA: DUF72 domain-containing protein [Planctomycetota bacterium]|nr:DUF72 domain-containing protein [Planctomycetota bacterium]
MSDVPPRVGTCGWQYRHWRGLFYPDRLRADAWLSFYVRAFDTVEVNSTFYRTPAGPAVERWRAEAPDGFLFATKLYRLITHERRLRPAHGELARALEPARRLGSTRGPLLVQLPSSFRRDLPRVLSFARAVRSFEPAFEFRHASWFEEPDLERRLNDAGGVLVTVDGPLLRTALFTAGPFVYVRFHGRGPGPHDYTASELDEVARGLRERLGPRQRVFAYFNNDVGGFAPPNARMLRDRLGGVPPADVQGKLWSALS